MGLGLVVARLEGRGNKRGDPKAAPNCSVVVMLAASLPLALNVIRWVQNGDVLAFDLEGRRFWFAVPTNDEIVFVDAGDYAEPPTIGRAVFLPVLCDDVGADAQRVPGVERGCNRVGLVGRRRG